MNNQIGDKEQNEKYPYPVFNVGDKASRSFYTDIEPVTVIAVERNGKKVTVQYDKSELAKGEKPEIVAGGFVGHCTNQRGLKYNITRNTNGLTEVFSLRKWRGRYCWTLAGSNPDGRQQINPGWRKFYDYNF